MSNINNNCNSCSKNSDKLEIIKKHINTIPDFPKKGIQFKDIFSVLLKPDVFQLLKDVLIDVARSEGPFDCVAALDSRGFLFGPLIALELKIPFVPIRKKGKLPGPITGVTYSLEYGQDTIEIQKNVIQNGNKVLIVDDLLATGGTMKAACKLIESIGGKVSCCLVVMELEELNGRKDLSNVISLIKY